MDAEDQNIESGYDGVLLKRLLKYAKKHYFAIALSMILLVVVVGIELIRPIIIGQAIDEVIVNYQKIYSQVSPEEGFGIAGTGYVEDEDNLMAASKATIIYDEGRYYFIQDLTYEEALSIRDEEGSLDDEGNFVTEQGLTYSAMLLTPEEIDLLRSMDYSALLRLMVIFIIILIAGLLIAYLQTILLHYTGQKIIYEIRDEVFAHIQGRSIEFFNQNPVGKLVTRVTNDTETLNEMYTSVIVNSVQSVLTLVGISVMMVVLNWRLALAVFLVLPLVLLSTLIFRKYSRKAYRDVRSRVSMVNTFLSEHISGMKIVQIFGKEKAKLKAFDDINDGLFKANMKELMVFGVYRPTMYLIYVLSLAMVLGFGGYQVMEGLLTIGVLVIYLQYISNFFDPIQQLAEQFGILQSAFAAAEKIFSLLDDDQSIENQEHPIALESVKGHIEFKNVWFAYNEDEYVLKDISFTVNPGETVAFVGATGAGKTSVLNLLTRYYDIQQGEILLDGHNIKTLDKHNIRKHVGQMLQDVFLFTGDIKENIRLGEESISDEDVVAAAKFVNAHIFIEKMTNKYDEHVFERGATLSAGQRQLLSFARTLAYKPSVLVLDEATANIDTETEVLIQDALLKLMENRTTLVVAHRLSTIQHADKIVVLHKGRIKEIGNHQTLLSKKGLYYNLYQLQYQELEEISS
ncbi:MAG: ABC transporter ATP-binding protein [Firmicutes bacterium HGW-Firmicutes-2]|jgi:ABC-type multidrug transport system fused ATPase/permease subunit|nr:MAG: ABC transporter ATP-binding protein [Firmicutes bacterium HGW-Firmicutes-2]